MMIYIRMIVLTDERVILSIVLKTNTNTTRLQHAHIDTPTDGIESSSRQTSTVKEVLHRPKQPSKLLQYIDRVSTVISMNNRNIDRKKHDFINKNLNDVLNSSFCVCVCVSVCISSVY